MDSTQRTRPRGGGSPVGLVIFIILTVVFAVLSYWGFAKYQEADQRAKTALTKEEQANKQAAAASEDLAALKEAAGAETPAALKEFVATTLDKTREAGFGSEAQDTAADALQASVKAIEAQRDSNSKLSSDVSDLTAQVKAIEDQRKAAADAYDETISNLQAEITSLNKQIENVKADFRAQLQKEIEERNRLQTEYYTAQDKWRDQELTYRLHVAELQERIRGLSGEGVIFGEADGVVTDIDRTNDKVTVDIGSAAGVKPGMRFVIYARNAAGEVVQKGVVEILDTTDEVSIAQMVSTVAEQAIGKGDFAYNLAGPEKRFFVFAGSPENYTMEEWANFIRANGGELVEEVQKGDRVADYLIMGKFEPEDANVVRKVQAARDFGLTILTENRLKEAMGLM